jgi:hypothetical protein
MDQTNPTHTTCNLQDYRITDLICVTDVPLSNTHIMLTGAIYEAQNKTVKQITSSRLSQNAVYASRPPIFNLQLEYYICVYICVPINW